MTISKPGSIPGAQLTNFRGRSRGKSNDPGLVRGCLGHRSVRKFLEVKNPDAAARAVGAIWDAIKQVECFPAIGKPVKGNLRQIAVHFGRHGYIVRYRIRPNDIVFVTRIWHGREER